MELKYKMFLEELYERYVTGGIGKSETVNLLLEYGFTGEEGKTISEALFEAAEDGVVDELLNILEKEYESDYEIKLEGYQ